MNEAPSVPASEPAPIGWPSGAALVTVVLWASAFTGIRALCSAA